MGWMWAGWFVGAALLLASGWALVRWALGRMRLSPRESPEQILDRRYSQGEFDRETYERMLQDLHA